MLSRFSSVLRRSDVLLTAGVAAGRPCLPSIQAMAFSKASPFYPPSPPVPAQPTTPVARKAVGKIPANAVVRSASPIKPADVWSKADDDKLTKAMKQGQQWPTIAAALGRSGKDCQAR